MYCFTFHLTTSINCLLHLMNNNYKISQNFKTKPLIILIGKGKLILGKIRNGKQDIHDFIKDFLCCCIKTENVSVK